MLALTKWSKVKMYSQGVFDVWYECPYCGYRSWARAYGVGEGMDTGLQRSASATHAQFQANVMAEHAAARAVHGSPCPRCGQHHPDIVRWAAQGERQEKQRALNRKIARVLRVVGMVTGVCFIALFATTHMPLENWVVLFVVTGASLVLSRVLLIGGGAHHRWTLYKRTAPGVTFLPESDDPSRPPLSSSEQGGALGH